MVYSLYAGEQGFGNGVFVYAGGVLRLSEDGRIVIHIGHFYLHLCLTPLPTTISCLDYQLVILCILAVQNHRRLDLT